MLKVAKYTFKWLNLLLCALENKLLNLANKINKKSTPLPCSAAVLNVFFNSVRKSCCDYGSAVSPHGITSREYAGQSSPSFNFGMQ